MAEGTLLFPDNGEENPYTKVDQIVHEQHLEKGSAIVILQRIQDAFGYVAPNMLERVSLLTGIHTSELYSIVTFYSQFRTQPIGENLIQVCHGTACHLAGAEKISETLEKEIDAKEGQTSTDGKFTIKKVACLGCCSHGPVVTVNDETYAKMTPEKARQLISEKKHSCSCHTSATEHPVEEVATIDE